MLTVHSSIMDTRAVAVRMTCWVVALVLGALHAWSGRHAMNIDGISYIDLGDALARADWANGINAHWSPLYAAMLGVVLNVVNPSSYWEFTAVHVVNFLIYAGALASFDFLLRELLRFQQKLRAAGDDRLTLPAWAWIPLAYVVFIWATLQLIALWVVTPDLAVAGVIFLAAALTVRIRRGAWTVSTFAALGAILGVGYLIKAPMFPLSLVFLTVAAGIARPRRRVLPAVATAFLAFAAVCAPLIIALSIDKGRPTFGESRNLAYAWFVNDVPLRHWQGGYPGAGDLQHPTRKILNDPIVYEFGTPVAGTYPVWYDPSYWYEGIRPRFDMPAQLKILRLNAAVLQDMLVSQVQGVLFLGFAILTWMGGLRNFRLKDLSNHLSLIVPGVIGLAMYAPISMFPRYVAPFFVLLWLAAYSAVRVPDSVRSRRYIGITAGVLLLTLSAVVAVEIVPPASDGFADFMAGEREDSHPSWWIANGVHELGVQPGDAVAFLHADAPKVARWSEMGSWARLARVRLVAEMLPQESFRFWARSERERARVLDAFTRSGARAVITPHIPEGAVAGPWLRIGATDHYLYWLRAPAPDQTHVLPIMRP